VQAEVEQGENGLIDSVGVDLHGASLRTRSHPALAGAIIPARNRQPTASRPSPDAYYATMPDLKAVA